MPFYKYECPKCGQQYEHFCHMKDLEDTLEITECSSDDDSCPLVVHRVFEAPVWAIIKKGKNWPDKERAIDKHMRYVQEVMDEGPRSDAEVQEGNEMLAEREKMMGYPEGYLTGNRPTEKVEVAADGGAVVDRGKLVQQMGDAYKAKGKKVDPETLARMASDTIKDKVGDTVTVERVKRLGKENLKQRAKAQATSRPRASGA